MTCLYVIYIIILIGIGGGEGMGWGRGLVEEGGRCLREGELETIHRDIHSTLLRHFERLFVGKKNISTCFIWPFFLRAYACLT